MKKVDGELLVSLVHPMRYGYDDPKKAEYVVKGFIDDINLSGIILLIEQDTTMLYRFIPYTNMRGIDWMKDKIQKQQGCIIEPIADKYILERYNDIIGLMSNHDVEFRKNAIITILNKIYDDGFEDGNNEKEG